MKQLALLCLVVWAISAQAQIPNTLTAGEKIYGLSRFWQEVNYNFVYLDKIDRLQWDSLYRATISIVLKTENDYQYHRELQRFCAFLKDGHTNVYFPPSIDSLVYVSMFGKYRLILTNIANKAIVTQTNPSIKDEIPVGSEIIEVNGLPTDEYIARHVAPYISSSTDYVLRDMSVGKLLQGLKGEMFTIRLKSPDGTMRSFSLTHEKTGEKELYPPLEKRELLDFRWYEKNIAYVALNSFGDAKIDSMFAQRLPELYNAKALIIDLRNNGGGSTGIGTWILQYLTSDSILFGSRQISRMHIPAYKAWGAYVKSEDTSDNDWAKKSFLHFRDKAYHMFEYAPQTTHVLEKRIVIPTALLIGHNTGSAAEDFLIYADNQKHMIKIGENSFGSTGQPYVFELPGGGGARVCTKKDTYPDGREFVGHGVKPDIEVKPTVMDFIKKRDPVLMKAIDYLRRKMP